MDPEHEGVVWMHAHLHISMVELSECSGLPEEILRELVECGALAPADPTATPWEFAADRLPALRAAARLCGDLELEAAALALVLSFLERIEQQEAELHELRARLARPLP